MNITFTNYLPAGLASEPILISGLESVQLTERTFLIIEKDDASIAYEIKYECHYSSFKEAVIIDQILAVGLEEYFYLFDLSTNTNILRLQMDGYFGSLYEDDGLFYVADSAGVYCIDKKASIHWQNNNLGVDGVIINDFTSETIYGRGEWDPPGGWRSFVLNKQTGEFKV